MREILYIQAGPIANYVGTHFWNTQTSYFTYGEKDEVYVRHDLSFREGLDSEGKSTYCPRVLIFDRKSNFGALPHGTSRAGAPKIIPSLWSGKTLEVRQDPLRMNSYQSKIALGVDPEHPPSPHEVSNWSDFSRVDFVRRSIQALPDVADWEHAQDNWVLSQQTFSRYDGDTSLMEGDVRLFLEECDALQGVQMINDTATYGGFMHEFITHLRDYIKTPVLAFPFLSSPIVDSTNHAIVRSVVNDALYLRSLCELSSLSIPIQPPMTWSASSWINTPFHPNQITTYYSSAVVSAHIESSTLPLRLNDTDEGLSSFVAQLNPSRYSPFAHLLGVLPVNSVETNLRERLFDFSTGNLHTEADFSWRDITRGFSMKDISSYQATRNTDYPGSIIIHTFPYPIPTSFPDISQEGDTIRCPLGISAQKCVRSLTSLSMNEGTAKMFKYYASFIENWQKSGIRRSVILESQDEDSLDGLRDLANDLWNIYDNCGAPSDDSVDSLDEDE